MRVLGTYREPEFSPGKVEADAAILDAVLAELRRAGAETAALEPARLASWSGGPVDLVLAMCQGPEALQALSAIEQSGALALNSALAIRNCYRDLLAAGLARARVPIPAGALVDTSVARFLGPSPGLWLSAPLYVKRGDLHALSAEDVKRVDNFEELRALIETFARRGVSRVYLQHAVAGRVIKFYGVSGGEFFRALPERGELAESVLRKLVEAGAAAAAALDLEVWGGDAMVDDEGDIKIIDFNDWPSFSRVREPAARAIARRATWLLRARFNRQPDAQRND